MADDDALSLLMSNSFSVTKSANSVSREHPRFSQYKNKGVGEKETAQDKRRRELLRHQKNRRDDFLKFARDLAEGNTQEEDIEDEDEVKEEEVFIILSDFLYGRTSPLYALMHGLAIKDT
jgi:hypothetical protein